MRDEDLRLYLGSRLFLPSVKSPRSWQDKVRDFIRRCALLVRQTCKCALFCEITTLIVGVTDAAEALVSPFAAEISFKGDGRFETSASVSCLAQ